MNIIYGFLMRDLLRLSSSQELAVTALFILAGLHGQAQSIWIAYEIRKSGEKPKVNFRQLARLRFRLSKN